MYHLHVYYKAKDRETRDRFYEEVRKAGIIEETHKEDGNLCYEYYFSVERDNEILIVENWKDRESQGYHDSLPHLVELGEIKEKYGIETQIEEL